MFKRAFLIVSAFIISIFSFMINITPVFATNYIAGWSPPQTQYWIRGTNDILYSPINSYGCFGSDTNGGQSCGFDSGGFSSYGYQPSNHSFGYHLYLLRMKSSDGQTPQIHGKGHIARVQFSVSMPIDNGTPDVQFLGSTYLLNGSDGEPWYFPLGVENISTSKLYTTDNVYPWEYVTTFDVTFVQMNDVSGGIPAFFPNIYVGSTASQTSAFIRVNNVIYYTDSDQYAADSASTLNDIKGLVQQIQSSSSTSAVVQQQVITNSKLDDVNTNITNLQQTQEQGNDDAQSRWEQDKQEESDREEQGNDDADTLSSLFSFTAFNPFSGLFGLFTGSDSCVAIPTIARLANAPANTTYCPWFPANVRSILTPVIGISSMMILFGFFIHWLNGSSKSFIIKEK